MTTGKTIASTRQTIVGKVMPLLFNMPSRLVITFLPRTKCLLIQWLQSPCTHLYAEYIMRYIIIYMLSRFSRVRLCATPETAAHQAPPPWDSPGKNTGAGCHFLLQRMKVKSESEVVQSCPTLCDPMDCSLPGSSIHGIFQAKYWSGVPLPSPHYMHILTYMQSTS